MKHLIQCLSLLVALVTAASAFASCTVHQVTEIPGETTPASSSATEVSSPISESLEPTTEETPFELPEDGVLSLLKDGFAPGTTDGRNPSLAGDKVIFFFNFAFKNAGLDLDDGTEITFKAVKSDKTEYEGTATLEPDVPGLKNDYGYVGVCFTPGELKLDRYESANFDFSFKDRAGKEYFVKDKKLFKGISFLGLSAEEFDVYLKDTVHTSVAKQSITQIGTINGTQFVLTIGLGSWAGNTKAEQIIYCSRLFWDCYPRMYLRFGKAANSPTQVELNIENHGYGIASTGGNSVHLHDEWLKNNRTDYDCLTHEFAHVIQNGWDGNYCEYSGYIERFADCCRYLYAFDNSKFNDEKWTLGTPSDESSRETSVRFLVWLDYTFSTDENDLLLKFFTTCRNKRFPAEKWDEAWQEIFAGTVLEGKSADEVWELFATSEFAYLSTRGQKGTSPLLKKYDVREKLKRYESYLLTLQA